MLCTGLIPTLAVGTVAYVTISRELSSNTADQLASISIKQEQNITGLLQSKQEEVTKLVNKYDFQVALANYLQSKHTSALDSINKALKAKKTEIPDIQVITLADLNGNVFASTLSGTTNQKLVDQTLLHSGDSTNITVSEDARDGINKLNISSKVSINKKESAIISVMFRTDDIVAALQDYTGLGATGETIIAEKDVKNNTVPLFPLRFNTDAALAENLSSLNLFEDTPATYTHVYDYRDQEVIVAARAIGFADWVVATKIDQKEAFAPIAQLRNSLFGIIIFSMAIIALLAWYLALLFTRPILRIAHIAKLIGQGDFSNKIDLHRSDEIGALGESINTMGLSLAEFVSSIEAQRNRLQIILDSTTESIVAIDKTGNIVIANHAAASLATRSIDGLVGKNINEVFMWRRGMRAFGINYNASGTNTYNDLQYTSPDNSTHFVRVFVGRISAQDQAEAQTIITIHDETKSRELEDMKIDFVSMAAHELRTPLAAVRGYLELLRYRKSGDTNVESGGYLQQALKSTAELGGLINNLLDVTRIERGTLALHMDEMDIADSVSQAVQDSQFSAQEKQIVMTYYGPPESCKVIGDEIALREVINNLLSNSIKYTLDKGQIGVTLERKDDNYLVHVKDTGIGIPRDALPNLFTKFYRVHGGLDSGSSGTGLGLFISKSIMERHGGSISVQSEEGKGSVFTYSIPVLTSDRLAAAHLEQSEQISIRRHRGWVTKNTAR